MDFKISGWSAIATVLIILLSFILSTYVSSTSKFLSITIIILSMIASALVLLGYLDLSSNVRTMFLKNMTIVSLIVLAVSTIFYIIDAFLVFKNLYLNIAFVVFGLAYLVFGISLFQLKDMFHGLAISLAIVYIIQGIAYASVIAPFTSILIAVAPFTSILVGILESILFFNASKVQAFFSPQTIPEVRMR